MSAIRKKLGDPYVLLMIACGFLILSLCLRITGAVIHELNRQPSVYACSSETADGKTVITCQPKERP